MNDQTKIEQQEDPEKLSEELLDLIRQKFSSGNDIAVERISLTRGEFEQLSPGFLK